MSCLDYNSIGVSTNILHNPRNILNTVSFLSQNFSAIELELEHEARKLLSADYAQIETTIEKLINLKTSKNLCLSVHAPYIGADCDLAAEDEEVRQISCKLLYRVIELSGRFGADKVTYHPGYVCSLPTEYAIENLKRSLNFLVPKAADLGIALCLENTGAERPSYQLFSPQQYIDLSQQTGTFLTLDLIHHASLFSQDGRLTDEFFISLTAMLPYVRNVHFADMVIPKHAHLPMGTGNLPVWQLLDFLGEGKYESNLIIEETGGGYSCNQFWEAACNFKDQYHQATAGAKLEIVCS